MRGFSCLTFCLCLPAAVWAQGVSFQPVTLYPAQGGPTSAATADFDGDGKPDVAIGNSGTSTVSIMLGKGDGTFTAGTSVTIPGGCAITYLAAGDFNNDGATDLLAICGFQQTIWVIPGRGKAQFGTPVSTPLPLFAFQGYLFEANLQGTAVADFNRDGKLDVALLMADVSSLQSDGESTGLYVLAGNGDGAFKAPATVVQWGGAVSTVPSALATADFNGDGNPDLALITTVVQNGSSDNSVSASTIAVYLGNGKGGFSQAPVLATSLAFGDSLAVADLDGDGVPDLVAGGISVSSENSGSNNVDSSVMTFHGKGDGTFTATHTYSEPNTIMNSILLGNFSGTGKMDAVESVIGNTTLLEVRPGNGDGTFQNPITIVPFSSGQTIEFPWPTLVAADWNGDGILDLAFPVVPLDPSFLNGGGAVISDYVTFYQQLPSGSLGVMLNALTPPPLIAVSHPQLQFSYTAGSSAPAPQSIAISNARTGAFKWTASSNASWLTVSPNSGTAPSTVSISVAAGLAANSYSGQVQISAAGASNSPVSIAVTLVVSAASLGPSIAEVVNGASFNPGIESGSWVTIKGANLANTNPGRIWRGDEIVGGNLPTSLDGVSVTIDGKPAFVEYISPAQINVQAPTDGNVGTVQVVVDNNGSFSQPFAATLQQYSPAFFVDYPTSYAVATRYPDNALIADPSAIPGAVAAKGGDIVILWGTGFGPTAPATPAGVVVTGAPEVATRPVITVGGLTAGYIAAVLTPQNAGLYQIAIQLPPSLPAGALAVQATVAGVQSPTGVNLFVGN